MTDVMKIARDRRAELHEESARLDEFIRMADSLMRKAGERTDSASDAASEPEGPAPLDQQGTSRESVSGIARMNLMRRGPAAING